MLCRLDLCVAVEFVSLLCAVLVYALLCDPSGGSQAMRSVRRETVRCEIYLCTRVVCVWVAARRDGRPARRRMIDIDDVISFFLRAGYDENIEHVTLSSMYDMRRWHLRGRAPVARAPASRVPPAPLVRACSLFTSASGAGGSRGGARACPMRARWL